MKCAVFILGLFLTVYGNGRANEASGFILDKNTFRGKDFEVKMKDNGTVTIVSQGRLLAECITDLAWRGVKFSNPEISTDVKRQELLVKSGCDYEGGVKVFCIRRLRAVGNELELITTVNASSGKDPAEYLPVSQLWAETVINDMGYDGGQWQCDSDRGSIVARMVESKEGALWKTAEGGGDYSVKQISFWQKGKGLGFSVKNTGENGMTLYDWGHSDTNGNPRVGCVLVMESANDKKTQTWRTTQIIAPAYRTAQDILNVDMEAKTKIIFPARERYGYFPAGYELPAEVMIAPGKETAGDYTAEFLLLDQTDKAIEKKAMAFSVTEDKEGKVKYDFVTPQQCALYWMRISVKDKGGNVVVSKEYPFAVTIKVPSPKDIPASSPLGGQPLAGGAMPDGRFVGIKWDRFWAHETSWRMLEPEKGKFDWEKADRMVDEAIKAGNEILWCLCESPNWASRLPQEKMYDAIAAQYPVAPKLKGYLKSYRGAMISWYVPPKDIKDWENFVRTIVRRYKTKVHYWQIWNEPWWDRKTIGNPVGGSLLVLYDENRVLKYKENGTVVKAEVWGFGGSIEDYANLVESASKIIHEEDPQGKVVAYGDYWVRDESSSDEFYKTGVGDYIDVLAIHYFYYDYVDFKHKIINSGWPTYGKQAITPTDNIIHDFDRRYSKYTSKHVPVWNTEEGSASCSSSGRSTPRPLTQAECEKLYGKKAIIPEYFVCMMSERRHACWEVQALLFSLGIGMDKVFLHSGRSISVPSMGKADYKLPTEKGIAWAAMASVVNTRKSVQYSPMGSQELDAVTITDISGKKTAVVWSHTGERKVSVRIPVGKNKKFKGMDFLGNPVALQSEKGWLTIDVCEEPLYIHDLDLGGIFVGDRNFISFRTTGKDGGALQVGKAYGGEIVICNPYAGRSIDGVLEASVQPSGKIAVEGKVQLAPGEEKVIPYSLELDKNIGECELKFILREGGTELCRAEMKRHISIPLQKALREMAVDGEAGDWEGIAEHKVNIADRVLVGLETPVYEQAPIRIWKGAEDLSFTVKSCWREDGLYFLVDVKDNEINPGPEPSCQRDCVEFFVDARNAAEQEKKEKTPGAIQFLVQPSLGDVSQECKIAFSGNDGKHAKALFTGRKTKTGYVVEGKVEPVGIQLKEGMMIGLDVAVDDGREPNPENKEERKSQMVWLGTEDNYKDTSRWGKFYLDR